MSEEELYAKIFANNLNRLMSEREKSQVDIINDLGFTRSAVSTWCQGTRLPRMKKVDALANYFGVKRSDLIEEQVYVDAPSKIPKGYELLDTEDRSKVDGFIQALLLDEKYKKDGASAAV